MSVILLNLIVSSLIVIGEASLAYHDRPRSSLCVKGNVSCTISDDFCTMYYFPANSTQCSNLFFTSTPKSVRRLTLSHVNLDTYRYKDRIYSQTAFNLSFTNIKWTDMKFRFSQNGNILKNTCRQFKRTDESISDIIYDCLWSDERYEGKSFTLEYEAANHELAESARLHFVVPIKPVEISKFLEPLLVILEKTPGVLGRTSFNIMWQPLPAESEVVSYRVSHIYNDTITGAERFAVASDVTCVKSQCLYTTDLFQGTVRFGVQPIFENGVGGVISKTPFIQLGRAAHLSVLIWLGVASAAIPVIVFYCLKWRQNVAFRQRHERPPKVLLVHSPTTTAHLHAVEALANYLNTHCRVVAWMDEIDIPSSRSKDPFEWCNEAISKADAVCVIASPFYGRLRSSSALFHTDQLLLRLLRERLGSASKTRYCALLLPYTSAADLPPEASNLRKLRLPGDLDSLLHLARRRFVLPRWILPAPPGGSHLYTDLGTELSDCLRAAHTDLQDNMATYRAQAIAVRDDVDVADTEQLPSDEAESSFIDGAGGNTAAASPLRPFVPRFDREGERQAAEQDLADFSGNINLLDLSGKSEESLSPVVETASTSTTATASTSSSEECAVDLNVLDL